MNRENQKKIDRRSVLRGMGLGVGAAGAAAVVMATGTEAQAEIATESVAKSAGYRETDHVRRVYELSRF